MKHAGSLHDESEHGNLCAITKVDRRNGRTPFAVRLRAARKQRGWSQMRLRAEAGVKIEALERGLSYPSYATLDTLCRVLGVSPCELMGLPCGSDNAASRLAEIRGLADQALREMSR